VARKAPKENALVRIELGIGGLLGLAVVVFCIFLWMYLFGVWTGQSGLQSTLATGDPRELISAATKMLKAGPPSALDSQAGDEAGGKSATVASTRQSPTAAAGSPDPKEAAKENSPSFFAIQVGAFREEQRALKTVAQWRAREYDAFYLKPDADGTFYRVLIGHFDSLAEANTLAAKLETSEQNKVFISLVSESQKNFPASP